MRFFLLFLAGTALAQRPSIGIKAGVPAADAFRAESWRYGRYHPDSGRYVIGPMFELRLPLRFSIEFDMLYRSVKYRTQSGGPTESSELVTTGDAWYFPLLAKVRLSASRVAPYVAAGLSFERLSGLRQVGTIITKLPSPDERSVNTDRPEELTRQSRYGYVLGVGLEGRLPVVRLAPEIRYTRWQQDSFLSPQTSSALSRLSQLEVLVGIAF